MKQTIDSDPVLSKVLKFTQQGWWREIDSDLRPHYRKRNEFSVEEGCLLCDMKVVVPTLCQKKVLEELHTSHPGIMKMKSLTRIHVWQPLINQCIEKVVQSCTACQSVQNKPATTLLHP